MVIQQTCCLKAGARADASDLRSASTRMPGGQGCIGAANLEAAAALRQIRIPVDPAEAIHVHRVLRHKLARVGGSEAKGLIHAEAVVAGPCLDEGPVEVVSVVGDVDAWVDLHNTAELQD